MSFTCAIRLFKFMKKKEAISKAFVPYNERVITRTICMAEFVLLWVYNHPKQTSCQVNKEGKVNDQVVKIS